MGNVQTCPTWLLHLSGKCLTVMENLTVSLTQGQSKGEFDSPCGFPNSGFDFGIQRKLMES